MLNQKYSEIIMHNIFVTFFLFLYLGIKFNLGFENNFIKYNLFIFKFLVWLVKIWFGWEETVSISSVDFAEIFIVYSSVKNHNFN